MAEPFIGEIKMFGGNFAPVGYALCQGQLMSIAQNTALFSILGTSFGGDGQVTFGLPDFRGRGPVHQGQGPGLSNYDVGEVTGVENITLTVSNLPAHNHLINASTANADQGAATGGFYAVPLDSTGAAGTGYTKLAPNNTEAATAVSSSGGSQPFETLQPLLCISFIIALEGVFPSRN